MFGNIPFGRNGILDVRSGKNYRRRQNAKNHLVIQQVTIKKCQWIAVIETSPFDSSTSQKAHTTLLVSGSSTMTSIIYNNAEEKTIGKRKKFWPASCGPDLVLSYSV